MTELLSRNFPLSEAADGASLTAVQTENARRLAVDVLQPARDAVGPIGVNSWCRSAAHNAEVGGAKGSAHLSCSGADLRPANVTSRELATWYFLHPEVPAGEVIWYTGTRHLHVTRSPAGGHREFLVDDGGRTRPWAPSEEDVRSLRAKLNAMGSTGQGGDSYTPSHPGHARVEQARESTGGAGGILLVCAAVGAGAWFRSQRTSKKRRR